MVRKKKGKKRNRAPVRIKPRKYIQVPNFRMTLVFLERLGRKIPFDPLPCSYTVYNTNRDNPFDGKEDEEVIEFDLRNVRLQKNKSGNYYYIQRKNKRIRVKLPVGTILPEKEEQSREPSRFYILTGFYVYEDRWGYKVSRHFDWSRYPKTYALPSYELMAYPGEKTKEALMEYLESEGASREVLSMVKYGRIEFLDVSWIDEKWDYLPC